MWPAIKPLRGIVDAMQDEAPSSTSGQLLVGLLVGMLLLHCRLEYIPQRKLSAICRCIVGLCIKGVQDACGSMEDGPVQILLAARRSVVRF